jgi:hypothetical protein
LQPNFFGTTDEVNIWKIKGKSHLTPPPFILGLLHSPIIKSSVLPPELSKTVYFTPWAVFSGGFTTVTACCYSNMVRIFFLFIFGEFLKKHSKS